MLFDTTSIGLKLKQIRIFYQGTLMRNIRMHMSVKGRNLVFSILMILSIQYARKDRDKPFQIGEALWDGIGGQYLFAQLMQGPIKELLLEILENLGNPTGFKLYTKLLEENRDKLDPELVDTYQSSLNEYDRRVATFGRSEIPFIQDPYDAILTYRFKPPSPISKISFHTDMAPKLRELLKLYEGALRHELGGYVESIVNKMNDPMPNRIAQTVVLVGPSGVGKTYILKEIAKCMRIEILEPRFPKQDLYGTKHYLYPNHGGVPGVIDQAILAFSRKNEHRCGILLLDEIDKLMDDPPFGLIQWLLDVTEENNTSLESNFFQKQIQRPHIFTVMTANESLFTKVADEKTKAALESRIKEIRFPPLSYEKKVAFSIQYFLDRAKREHVDIAPIAKELIPLVKADKNDGIRGVLRDIDQLLLRKKNEEFFGDWLDQIGDSNGSLVVKTDSPYNHALLFSSQNPAQKSREEIASLRLTNYSAHRKKTP